MEMSTLELNMWSGYLLFEQEEQKRTMNANKNKARKR